MPQLTIQHAYDLALQHHRAGRLPAAEQLYRQILAADPGHADAMHLLGVLAHQSGRNDIALDLIRRAIVLRADFPEALNNLGNVLQAREQLDEAVASYSQAISLRPNYPEAHNNLGNALKRTRRFEEAIAEYRQAIALLPDYTDANVNLAIALTDAGQLEEAIAIYRRTIAHQPRTFEAYNNLGLLLKKAGQLDEAIATLRLAISARPNSAEAHLNLGDALREKREFAAAVATYREAIRIRPDYAEAYSNLGNGMRDAGYPDKAIAAYRKAIAIKPDLAEAHNNLGNALNDLGQLDEAIAAYRAAIALKPKFAQALSNLGNVLKDTGELDEAIMAYRAAVAADPGFAAAASNLVFAVQLHPRYDAAAIAEESRRWDRQHAEPLRHLIVRHSNDRAPDRRLRIGYLSADFRNHVVGRNILPLFLQHDRNGFEITCYAHVTHPDEMTDRFQKSADRWRNIVGVSDEQAAALIREDKIDILVDLTLHLSGNRLLIFARKPAPVQATFAGYPGSTGLRCIDYRLSDPYLDPAGMDQSVYSEQTIRLPDSFWCYDPMDCRDVSVNALPAVEQNAITFGCLNNLCKVNDAVLSLWAKVLQQVDASRLVLLSNPGAHRERTIRQLAAERIDPARVTFAAYQPRRQYLERYRQIDIGLDSFPYNGHTTSLDSFWMGVPVVTLIGQSAVSRAGWSILSNLGLTELAAATPDQFVQIAVGLASDLPRLRELRLTLRERMERSPLMDAPKFAGNIESAYRQMWRAWSETAIGEKS
jgi:predicted O-linked N-acetylglucosamine transferase (SPINDLY family)